MSNKFACAPNEDLDQPAHLRSLIRVLAVLREYALDSWLPSKRPAKTDQIAQMRRLMLIFAGRTCGFVGNAVLGSIYIYKERANPK